MLPKFFHTKIPVPLFECEASALQLIADDLALDPRETFRVILRGEAARRGIPCELPRVGTFSKPSKISESLTPALKRAVARAIRDAIADVPQAETILFKVLLPKVNKHLKDDERISGPLSLAKRLRLMGFATQARRKNPMHNYGEVLIDARAREIVEKILRGETESQK